MLAKYHRRLQKFLNLFYVCLSLLYALYIVYKFGNFQTDGLFAGIAALIALNIAYINTLFNRARSTESDAIRRRCIAAAETALRGFVLLLLSTLIVCIEYGLADTVFQLQPAFQNPKSIAPTYPLLAFIALLTTAGVPVSIILTLDSISILVKRHLFWSPRASRPASKSRRDAA